MSSDVKNNIISGLPFEATEISAPAQVALQFSRLWAAGDIDSALLLVAEDAAYALHISGEVLPFAGETVGRDNIAAALRKIRNDFEYLLYRPLDIVVEGDRVRYQVEFMYRHRASGEVLSGRFRIDMRVENGMVARVDEYHDRAKVEAFMRLFAG